MSEKEMINSLQNVWNHMTMDKNVTDYQTMLVLLDNMVYLLRYDYQIKYPPDTFMEPKIGDFDF